jgi:peptidoglycan hydrolase CwlO-like protein
MEKVNMKRAIILLIVIAAFLIAAPLTGSAIAESTSDELAKETKEAYEAFKAYMIDKKNDAVAHGKDLLKKTDAEVDKLQAKADEASGDAKDAYKETIDDLKEKRAVAGEKLDELGNASADSWDDAKEGFTEAYKALYDAYKKAVANFK